LQSVKCKIYNTPSANNHGIRIFIGRILMISEMTSQLHFLNVYGTNWISTKALVGTMYKSNALQHSSTGFFWEVSVLAPISFQPPVIWQKNHKQLQGQLLSPYIKYSYEKISLLLIQSKIGNQHPQQRDLG